MRDEAKRIEKWICGCCHSLEKTSNSGRRFHDPSTMPNGKAKGTKEEVKQYSNKHSAKIKYPKHQYVDAKKREIGKCQYPGCNREVVERGVYKVQGSRASPLPQRWRSVRIDGEVRPTLLQLPPLPKAERAGEVGGCVSGIPTARCR